MSFEELRDLLTRIFIRHGASEVNARILGANCAGCERDGALSHGIFRIPGYVASLESGWADGRAVPTVDRAAASFLRIDAANGFAQPALAAATARIIDMAGDTGVSVAAIRDSHHFSALWPDLEPFADRGLVALAMVSGLACVAPPGGRKAVFGTNPIAFATPVAGSAPLIFDFATSAMSNGDLRLAARSNESVPRGTGIDRSGALTENPGAILDGGALLPFGGHKGAAISLMVEVLASALTGGQFSSEVDFSGHPGAETPRTGQIVIVIDPAHGNQDRFAARVARLIQFVREAGQLRLPSDRRLKARARSERDGIPIRARDLDALASLAS